MKICVSTNHPGIVPDGRFLVPVSMIICNDIMAYMFGFFFGKTPLIKLSPKKTWEGFIGGAASTVLFGIGVSSRNGRKPWIKNY